jgi:hypothetical protein
LSNIEKAKASIDQSIDKGAKSEPTFIMGKLITLLGITQELLKQITTTLSNSNPSEGKDAKNAE